jgi:hypothetical protein
MADPGDFSLEYRLFVCETGSDGVDGSEHPGFVLGDRVHELVDAVTWGELDRISGPRQSLAQTNDNGLFVLDLVFFAFEGVPGAGHSLFLLADPGV